MRFCVHDIDYSVSIKGGKFLNTDQHLALTRGGSASRTRVQSKSDGDVDVLTQVFLNWTLIGGKWLASYCGRFTPREIAPLPSL